MTRLALIAFLEMELDLEPGRGGRWTVDPLEGPQVCFLNLAVVPARRIAGSTATGWSPAGGRWGRIVDRHVANVLRRARRTGSSSPRRRSGRCIEELDDLLAEPTLLDAARAPRPLSGPAGRRPTASEFAGGLETAVGGLGSGRPSSAIGNVLAETRPAAGPTRRAGPGSATSRAAPLRIAA